MQLENEPVTAQVNVLFQIWINLGGFNGTDSCSSVACFTTLLDRRTFFPHQMCVRFRGVVEAGEGGSQELFIFIAKPPLYCFYFHLLVSLRKHEVW